MGRWLVPRLAFCVLAFVLAIWALALRSLDEKDWRVYHDTALLVASGRVADLYPGVTPGLPFFYPPFFVWHLVPLALVPRTAVHACVALAMTVATAVALWALRAALDGTRRPVEAWIWVVLSSAGFTWMLIAGHVSGWYLLVPSLALLLWQRDRPMAAGLVLSLLLTKPQYGLVLLGFVALARGWRVLAGASMGAALLTLSTVPLGWSAWRAWAVQARSASTAIAAVPAWKQITLRGTWMSIVGANRPDLATALWLGTALPVALLAAWACHRVGSRRDLRGRVLGLAVLVALACGPYAFQYDGLLLAIPGLVWYFQPSTYRSSRAHAASGAAILATYAVQQVDGWILQRGVVLTGLALTTWLVLDALDLLHQGALPADQAGRAPPESAAAAPAPPSHL